MASVYAGGTSSGSAPVSPVDTGRGSTTNPKMRKRTKTGCLTCRKRRIKCGEERPTCNNCIKSKRQCEGYNQRVVFKPPIGDWPGHPGAVSTMQFHSSHLPVGHSGYRAEDHSPQSPDLHRSSGQQQPTHFEFAHAQTAHTPDLQHLNTQHTTYLSDPNYHRQPVHSPQSQLPTPASAGAYFSAAQASPVTAAFPASYGQATVANYGSSSGYSQAGSYQQSSYDAQADSKPATSQAQSMYEHSQPLTTASAAGYPQYAGHRCSDAGYAGQISQADYTQRGQYSTYSATSHAHSAHSSFPSSQIPQHDVTRSDVSFLPQHSQALERPVAAEDQIEFEAQLLASGFGGEDHVSPTQVLDEAAVECEDDSYYDVQSDEGTPDEPEDYDENYKVEQQDFSLIQRMHRESTSDLDVRRYDSFIYEGILAHYRPEQVANPLKNPKTARVFMHFIHVTGPTLSMYERNPRNPSVFGSPAPPSHQSLWTYTLPMQALKHQSLLHAMLAMASLHIAKLQKASITPSWKHYAYSLKRLFRALGNPKRRLTVPTLATALLLAFYEVMTAELAKWSTHLGGAAQLLVEMDFRSLTQEARRLRAAHTAQEKMFPFQNPDMVIDQKQFDKDLQWSAIMPDAGLVSTIVGKHVDYDDFGRVFEEGSNQSDTRKGPPERFDLQNYETLQDLYWWYCRQDMIQSVVSGNPLNMDYRKWSDCPPRAPLGRIDVLAGTHDHIILLLGRIADFIVGDRERKIKQVQANGGQWRPTPGMPGMGPSPESQGQTAQPATPTTPMGPPPHMQGMGPPPGWSGPPPPGWTGGPPPGWRGSGGPSGGPPAPNSSFSASPDQPQSPTRQQPRGPPPTAGPGFYGMAPSRPPASIPSSYTNPNATRQYQEPSPADPTASKAKFQDLPAAYGLALNEWNSISAAHATMASHLSKAPGFASLTDDQYPIGPGASSETPFGRPLRYGSYDISILWAMLHLAKILLLRSHPAMPPAAMVAAAVCAKATEPYAILIGRIAAGLPLPPDDEDELNPLTPALGAAHIESTYALFFAAPQYNSPVQRDWLITRLLGIDRRTGWASAGVIARACETAWERAGEIGQGPPYRRRTRRFGESEDTENYAEDSPGTKKRKGAAIENLLRRQPPPERDAAAGAEVQGDEGVRQHRANAGKWDEKERRYVVKHRSGYVPWAMNVMADDEDLMIGMGKVDLGGDGGEQASAGAGR